MKKITIGLTERHGMAVEQQKYSPKDINYEFLDIKREPPYWLTSPIKGFGRSYSSENVDAIEAVLSPIITSKPWFYSLACYEEAIPFGFLGAPLPKAIRNRLVCNLFKKSNFKSLIFWSKAGLNTLRTYGGFTENHWIWEKSEVIYPAIRFQRQTVSYSNQKILLLFNVNFFIKGGANVVDVFEKLQAIYRTNIELVLCCDEEIDFHTGDPKLKERYLDKIKRNPSIKFGRVPRDVFLHEILPSTDIYLLPSYGDAFGFAILEAMSFGIPVIATNYMAIPEMIDDGENGMLIDISLYQCQKMFPGCYVQHLPDAFREYVSEMLFQKVDSLLCSKVKRQQLGESALQKTREHFSFEIRNTNMRNLIEKYLERD